jgi:L-rhamnose mutarotase
MSKIVFGQLGRLKREKIAEYEALHADPFPGVTEMIHACNLRNYSIFRHEDLVFAYFEYVGDDYDADMAKMEADPVTQHWWTFTKPCFEKFSIRPDSEFYADLKQIFHFE